MHHLVSGINFLTLFVSLDLIYLLQSPDSSRRRRRRRRGRTWRVTLHVDDGCARCSDEEWVVDHVFVALVGGVPLENAHGRVLLPAQHALLYCTAS